MSEDYDLEKLRCLEAILFASQHPMHEKELQQFFPPQTALKPLLDRLTQHYAMRGVNLVYRGESWAFRTALDLRGNLQPLRQKEKRLSRAALETLAIIAYHQPVTRAEIETIRAVSSSRTVFDPLLKAGWIAPGPRKPIPGKPGTWKTTDAFLDAFGLEACEDLPGIKELSETGFTMPSLQWLGMEQNIEKKPKDKNTEDKKTQ